MNKKLIVIIGSLDVGGTERHLVSILPHLQKKGWKIEVKTLSHKGVLAPYLEEQGIEVTAVLTLSKSKTQALEKFPRWIQRVLKIILRIWALTRQLKKEDASTILHFYLPESYVLGMLAAKLAGFSGYKIMSRRSLNDYQTRRPGVSWFEKRLHRETTAIIGNSQAIIRQLNEAENVPLEHLHLIYNGVNMGPFVNENNVTIGSNATKINTRKELNIPEPETAYLMIIIANLIAYKGHSDLLTALKLIKDQLPKPWYLLCVGRDNGTGLGDALKKQTLYLGLQDHVQWLGSRDDIPDLLRICDLGILCSHEEGFSNAILEGMAAGLPMVVTDVGGNKEAVMDGATGYVIPPKNPKALSKAILKLAHDPQLSKTLGEAGCQRVMEQFSLEACVNAYIKLYDNVGKHALSSCFLEKTGL